MKSSSDLARKLASLALGLGLVWYTGSIVRADDAISETQPAAESSQPAVSSPSAETDEPATTESAETFTLRYKFVPGQVVRYLVDDKTVVDLEYGSAREVFHYKTTSWKHYTVKTVNPDGTAAIELVIDRAKMEVNGDGRKLSFDTNSVGAPPHEFAQFVSLIEVPRVITISPVGVLSAPDKAAAVFEKAAELDQQNTNVLIRLPEKAIAVGTSWKDDFDIEVVLEELPKRRNVRLRRLYTLASIDGDVASIDLQTIVLNVISDPKIEAQLIQRTLSGVIRFDFKTGRILSREGRLSNEVVNFGGPGSKIRVDRTLIENVTTEDGSKAVASSR